jgi:hypothetical protein
MSQPTTLDETGRPHTAAWWLQQVTREERRGELLTAFDVAQRGLGEHPADLRLRHRAVLCLARTGATAEAARRFEQYGLELVADEDVASLRARIAKDLALAADGPARQHGAAAAARLYAEVFVRTGGFYPAINAATLWLLSGDGERAATLAKRACAAAEGVAPSYYSCATQAEALLILRQPEAARGALSRAVELDDGDLGALATTRRQLRLVCELSGVDQRVLDALAGRPVVFFCGHRVTDTPASAGLSRRTEAAVKTAISEVINRYRPGCGYGALASGADILWAEALLTSGAELQVVLPCVLEEFVRRSVAPAGADWIARFDRCLERATAVHHATEEATLTDDVLFRYGSELAMGLALLRGRYLDAEVRQLAVWDGLPARGAAGTAIDVNTWSSQGRPVTVISPTGEEQRTVPQASITSPPIARHGAATTQRDHAPGAAPVTEGQRTIRAMLFGDLSGFSKLTDEQIPVFAKRVLATWSRVLRLFEQEIWHQNTWGDALYLVLTDAVSASRCALALQEALETIDLTGFGLPADLSMRLGGHVGPVFAIRDPVLEQTVFMGAHVSRTARVEPVTPPGAVYVTEPFAAALALAEQPDLVCDYVGHQDAAKGYGAMRMYRLRRATPTTSTVAGASDPA